jgi:hypothetical protein
MRDTELNSIENTDELKRLRFEILETPLSSLKLSVRLRNVLITRYPEHFDNRVIGDLVEYTEDDFIQLKNCGKSTLVEARSILNNYSLVFGMGENDVRRWIEGTVFVEMKQEKSIDNMTMEGILNSNVMIFDFNVRTQNVLYNKKITKVNSLVMLDDKNILNFKNAGLGTVEDIKYSIEKVGLRLNMSQLDIDEIIYSQNDDILEDIRQQKRRRIAKSKFQFVKINIPPELANLPIASMLLMSDHIDFNERYGSIKRILNNFKTLGDLDGHTIKTLSEMKNVGKNVILILEQLLDYFITDTYESLTDRFSYYSSLSCDEIDCSPYLRYFLHRYSINLIEDIYRIDALLLEQSNTIFGIDNSVKNGTLSDLDKLCLLELRSLRTDGKKFFTNSNAKGDETNFISWIDKFMSRIKKDWQEILLLKWNDRDIYLEDVAKKVGLTRERVRQVIRQSTLKYFKLFYMYDDEEIQKYWYFRTKKIMMPINILDHSSNMYTSQFYRCFLNNYFPNIPLVNFLFKSEQSWFLHNTTNWYGERGLASYKLLSSKTKSINKFTTNKYLTFFDTFTEKNWALKLLLSLTKGIEGSFKEYYKLSNVNSSVRVDADRIDFTKDDFYINRVKISKYKLIENIIYNSISPLKLDEICDLMADSGYYDSHQINKDSVFTIIGRSDDIITIDRHVWGTIKHLSYQSDEWNKIQRSCEQILLDLKHQASASYLFNIIYTKFPLLVSKYELVFILRQCNKFSDLGFHTFGLPQFNQDERLKITDIINKLFEDDPNPKHNKYIYNEIIKVRTMRLEGIPVIFRRKNFRSYPPGYYGLSHRHRQNVEFLSRDFIYIEKYIRSLHLDTSVDSISEYFGFDEADEMQERIVQINSLNIVKDPFSDKKFVLRAPSTGVFKYDRIRAIRPLIKIILFNTSKPLTVEEIKYFFLTSPSTDKEGWYKKMKNLDDNIISIIKSDNKYKILSNGSILFSGDTESNIELLEIRNEVVEYISSLNESIQLIDLFNLVCDMSEHIKTKKQLGYLLNTEERIEINNGVVSILDE